MKLLILENESYLAQNIASKFSEIGFEVTIAQNLENVQPNTQFEVILISSVLFDSKCELFIKKNTNSIIIMMISYVSDDTVNKPIQAGAKDYILKPLIIDELVRKVEHHYGYYKIQKELNFYNSYFNFIQKELNLPAPLSYNPPFIIRSNSQRGADIYAMKYAKEKGVMFDFVSLRDVNYQQVLHRPIKKGHFTYITNLEELKKNDKKEFLEAATKKHYIMSFVSHDNINFPHIIDLSQIAHMQELGGEIMPINEYVKAIILKFENRYPDIELAKRLGISRKSLWEKRKKYGIVRKK